MNQNPLLQVKATIEANIGNPSFGAEELGRMIGMSHSNLLRKVRSLTGKSINQLIQEARLNKAMELIRDEEISVSEAAFRVGFSSPSYFTACFRKQFGFLPGEVKAGTPGEVKIEGVEEAKGVRKVAEGKGGRRGKRVRRVILAAAIVVLFLLGGIILLTSFLKYRENNSIAVLPFQNLKKDTLNDMLCENLWNEVIISLEKVKVFEVRSAVSSNKFRDRKKSINEIGKELDADYIVEASINWVQDSIKIWVKLYDSKINQQKWGEEYTRARDLSLDLMREMAQDIAYQLHTRLFPWERAQINEKPTKSQEAWEAYLNANAWMDHSRGNVWPERAVPLYRKAIGADSSFRDAYISLAYTMYTFIFDDPRDEIFKEWRQANEKAHAIRPGPDSYRNWGIFYLNTFEFRKSEFYFRKGLKANPRNYGLVFSYGKACRQSGKWDKAEKLMQDILEFTPRSFQMLFALGETRAARRDFAGAVKYYNECKAINPEWILLKLELPEISMRWKGDTTKAREMIWSLKIPKPVDDDWNTIQIYYQRAMIDLYEGKYADALEEVNHFYRMYPPVAPPYYFRPKYLLKAMIYGYLGNPDLEKAFYDSTRIFVEDYLGKYPVYQKDPLRYGVLGMAYAGLGKKEKALEMAEKVKELLKANPNAFTGPHAMEDVAWIYMKTGDHEKALKTIRKLLSEPGPLTTALLELDPKWAPLRNLPEYKRIKDKYSIQ